MLKNPVTPIGIIVGFLFLAMSFVACASSKERVFNAPAFSNAWEEVANYPNWYEAKDPFENWDFEESSLYNKPQRLGSFTIAPDALLIERTAYYLKYYESRREELQKALYRYNEILHSEVSIPDELRYLPLVLSACNPYYLGETRGAGLWQLQIPVAARYGLIVSSSFDQRRDISLSTKAAISWYKELQKKEGASMLALCLFIYSPATLQRALKESNKDFSYSNIYNFLPESQRDILPALLALEQALKYWSPDLNRRPSYFQDSEIVESKNKVHFKSLEKFLDIKSTELMRLNPSLISDHIPECNSSTKVRLPKSKVPLFYEKLDTMVKYQNLHIYKPYTYSKASTSTSYSSKSEVLVSNIDAGLLVYTVSSGDNLGYIAQKFNVKVSQIEEWNNLDSDRINIGQKLKVYVPKEKAAALATQTKTATVSSKITSSTTSNIQSTTTKGSGTLMYHTVKNGESLWLIAKKYPGISAEDIQKWNGCSEKLQPGQKLKIYK